MKTGLENTKEQKDISTATSNNNQEIDQRFKEEDHIPHSLLEKKYFEDPNTNNNNSNDFISLVYDQTLRQEVPSKFLKLTKEQLEFGLSFFVSTLPENTLLKLQMEFFGTNSKPENNKLNFAEFEGAIKKGCEVFEPNLKLGFYDQNYQDEQRLSNLLDRYFYDNQIMGNLRKASHLQNSDKPNQNQEKEEFKCDEKATREVDWKNLDYTPTDDQNEINEESEESVSSNKFQNVSPPENPKSLTLESPDKESKYKKTVKKSFIFVPKTSLDDIKNYHYQELERYNNPTAPYIYVLKNGEQRWVAPVCRKFTETSTKPRDHILLVSDRPTAVTILSLVRDAAAKLPKGCGTRSEICEILKESQFINNEIEDDKMSSVVSGALDRLHYENDPCVRFDSKKKLWSYLHIGRQDRTPLSSERESNLNIQTEKMKSKKVKAT